MADKNENKPGAAATTAKTTAPKPRFTAPSAPARVDPAAVKRSEAERDRARAGAPVRPRPVGRPRKADAVVEEIKDRVPARVTAADVTRFSNLAKIGNPSLARLEKQVKELTGEDVTDALVISETEADTWGGATAGLMASLDPDGFLARSAPVLFFGVATFGIMLPRAIVVAGIMLKVQALQEAQKHGGHGAPAGHGVGAGNASQNGVNRLVP